MDALPICALGRGRKGVALLDVGWSPPALPAWPDAAVLAEEATRPWAEPGNGGIVCHCELVTRREIEAALAGPLPARSLAGLKRRTRVTMGRCQGFYCLGALAEIRSEEHTSELQSLMRISYAVFCLKKNITLHT